MTRALPHPTPSHIALRIAEAMRRHEEAHPDDRFPMSARRVIRDGIRRACEDHDKETGYEA